MRVTGIDVGLRDMGFCTVSLDLTLVKDHKVDLLQKTDFLWSELRIEYWNCMDILQSNSCHAKNSRAIRPDRLISFMIHAFDDHPFNTDQIVIEQQPRFSPSMKAMGYAIVAYCMTKYPQSKTSFQSSRCKGVTGSSTHNFGEQESKHSKPRTNGKSKRNDRELYNARKIAAKKACERILELAIHPSNKDAKLQYQNAYAKQKDDYADSLLHALYVLQKEVQKIRKKETRSKRTAISKKEEEDFSDDSSCSEESISSNSTQ